MRKMLNKYLTYLGEFPLLIIEDSELFPKRHFINANIVKLYNSKVS